MSEMMNEDVNAMLKKTKAEGSGKTFRTWFTFLGGLALTCAGVHLAYSDRLIPITTGIVVFGAASHYLFAFLWYRRNRATKKLEKSLMSFLKGSATEEEKILF